MKTVYELSSQVIEIRPWPSPCSAPFLSSDSPLPTPVASFLLRLLLTERLVANEGHDYDLEFVMSWPHES